MSQGSDLIQELSSYVLTIELENQQHLNKITSLQNQNELLQDELFRILFKDLPTKYISGIRDDFTNKITTIKYIRSNSKNSFLQTLYGSVTFYAWLEKENFNE